MSERTKQHIQQAFYTLLKTNHLSDITVQDICDQAMIHRSTFYRHYDDKYIVLNILIESTIKELYTQLPFSESEKAFITHLINYIDNNRSLFKHITKENSDYVYKSLDQFISQTLLQNASKYEDGLSQKIRNAKHPELISDFYSSGIRKILENWVVNHDNQYTKDEIIDFFDDILK